LITNKRQDNDRIVIPFLYFRHDLLAPFAAGVRSHLFIMRDGPRFYIGAAGTVGENKLVSDTAFVGNKGFDIGYALAASLDPKALKIDEWRVFSGEASYPTSGNYLPPTFPFPDP
jgi:hypothetical protein